ncbi:MAG: acetyl xylan esterase [Gammaproteobacteria bacterium]|nr:acetyl xylan esterase [Escherichia coli]EFD5051931.1 acetyl xylan esterase [Escherichia coli]NCB61098.1 acetyl xylan esterase [Gammaproteobacteria bacterium]RCP68614.1 acetyl xylan esterase [Escherichia coli]HAH2779112.1 acetyl xylan esterase [Escherichia coli]
MQVQRRPQAAPGLAQSGSTGTGKRMQNHAPFGCMA